MVWPHGLVTLRGLLWFVSVFKFSSVQQQRADNFSLKFLKFSKCSTNVNSLATKYLGHFAYVFMNNFRKGLWHTCTIILYGNWRKKNLGRMFVFIFLLLTTLFGRTAKFDSKLARIVTFFPLKFGSIMSEAAFGWKQFLHSWLLWSIEINFIQKVNREGPNKWIHVHLSDSISYTNNESSTLSFSIVRSILHVFVKST